MTGNVWALLGATMAIILGGFGSSLGCGMVGVSAAGLVSREPEKFGSTILLQVLPGTQGIFGFLSGYLVLNKIKNVLAAGQTIDTNTGLMIFAACLPMAFVGLLSAIYQAKVASAGINIVAKAGTKYAFNGVIYAAVVETYSILALVATLMLLNAIQLPASASGGTGILMPILSNLA